MRTLLPFGLTTALGPGSIAKASNPSRLEPSHTNCTRAVGQSPACWRFVLVPSLLALLVFQPGPAVPTAATAADLPKVPDGWKIELAAEAPRILFPTAVVQAPDGTVYLGQDPMDMPGPTTTPIDSVVALRDGKITQFAEKLWSVMGLEWLDDTLYVVHAPFLSALRDTNGDGQADERVDLVTGLGPKLPGFSGMNDHIAAGIRMGMDGFLYVAVGDKGIPKATGRDGATISLRGGGVIRVRPDGTGLEVVSTGERSPLSVALTAADDIFTYGNDDDSKKWPNSLTHHIVGGHYGYPYEFLTAPQRALPIVDGQIGGAGAQGVCYNEAALPDEYRGDLFFADWGLQTVFRYKLEPVGGTFRLNEKRTPFVTRGNVRDFRPFSLAVANDGNGFWLVDWAYDGWLTDGPRTGRLYRLSYDSGRSAVRTGPQSGPYESLDHPALSERLNSQRALARLGAKAVEPLSKHLGKHASATGRIHALWALDAIGTPEARQAIRTALTDGDAAVRRQAARSAGIARDRAARDSLVALLRDPDAPVRREAAIALGRLGEATAAKPLMAALDERDAFAAWSVGRALRRLNAWDEKALTAALLDPSRGDNALKLADESWAVPVVTALGHALVKSESPALRARIVSVLAGLYRKEPAWSGQWYGTNPLAGPPPRKTEDWDAGGMKRVLLGLAIGVRDADSKVRRQAILGLRDTGPAGAPFLREALSRETVAANAALVANALGRLGDGAAVPDLAKLVQDPARPEEVRLAAIDALGMLAGPQALRARFALAYDRKAPPALVARVLPELGREGVLPVNDAASFLEHPSPTVRAAALLAMNPRRAVPADVKDAVLARCDDTAAEVRLAAIEAAVTLKLREVVPRLLAAADDDRRRDEALRALIALPDTRAVPLYLAALDDRSPAIRAGAERALITLGDEARDALLAEARAGRVQGRTALALERVLARFAPVVDWHVIGPFPHSTAQRFFGEPAIDLARTHTGAGGRTVAWEARAGDRTYGRVVLDDLKASAGESDDARGGAADLCAFAYAEVDAERDGPALLRAGSSGALAITVNQQLVLDSHAFAARPYAPDSDVVRLELKQGKNRVLVRTRQGLGTWSFSMHLAQSPDGSFIPRAPAAPSQALAAFARRNQGDPKQGESLFFEHNGTACARCHAAGGRGTARIGPDLTGLALKYDKAEIIRSVLEPSARMANGYHPVLIATKDGKMHTGLVRSESDGHLELVDASGRVTRLEKSAIAERRTGDVSLMPTGLVESLSMVEFADLIAYLQTLRTVADDASARRQ